MRTKIVLVGTVATIGLLAGCCNIPPGAERGPHCTMAYNVPVEASEPGVRIEANGQFVGTTPMTLKIFGDPDGTFHDFGSYYYVIQAIPAKTNQYVQTGAFRTGHLFTPEDYIPKQVHFDMNQPPPPYPANPPPAYAYPPPYYPYYYYGPPYYYGPRGYVGPPGYWYRRYYP